MPKPTPLQFTPAERARWARQFACRTPEKIRVSQPIGGYYDCNGCSGSCGCTDFPRDPKPPELKQATLI